MFITNPNFVTCFNISPTYTTIMHEPITALSSSQSTEAEIAILDAKPNDDDVIVSFADLQFNPQEDNVPDDMIMPGK